MRRRLSILLTVSLLGAAALSVGQAPASASGTLTFYGSGDGHGLGMSQWGAYGLALDGWGYRKILTHFYRATDVQAPALRKKVRVGLTTDRSVVHLTAKVHAVRIWVGRSGTGTVVGSIPPGDKWTVRAK